MAVRFASLRRLLYRNLITLFAPSIPRHLLVVASFLVLLACSSLTKIVASASSGISKHTIEGAIKGLGHFSFGVF